MAWRLDPLEVNEALRRLPAWRSNDDATTIERRWRLADFAGAFELVERIAALAETANHHPDIRFGWGYLFVTLSTHDASGITAQDFALAEHIDAATAGA